MDSCAGLAEARGCPIRIFTDQSLFAAPRNFSQRTTSFIASQCQGIHQMLLSRLMLSLSMPIPGFQPRQIGGTNINSKKDLYVLDLPVMVRSSSHVPLNSMPFSMASRGQYKQIPSFTMSISITPAQDRAAKRIIRGLNGQMPDHAILFGWWSQTGSNRRPQACKASALPTELWPRPTPTNQETGLTKPNQSWWAWEDLNFRPHAYQARALTN